VRESERERERKKRVHGRLRNPFATWPGPHPRRSRLQVREIFSGPVTSSPETSAQSKSWPFPAETSSAAPRFSATLEALMGSLDEKKDEKKDENNG
jgi:hypothetical protein